MEKYCLLQIMGKEQKWERSKLLFRNVSVDPDSISALIAKYINDVVAHQPKSIRKAVTAPTISFG